MVGAKQDSESGLSRQAIFFMALLTVQFGAQPMLTAKFTPKTVCRSTVIILQEALKFCLATFMLIATGGFKDASKSKWEIFLEQNQMIHHIGHVLQLKLHHLTCH